MSEIKTTDKTEEIEEITKKPAKKHTFLKIGAIVVSGLIFGSTASGAFYGVNKLLNKEQTVFAKTTTEQTETTNYQLQPVSYTTGDSSTSQSLDVSDIAEGMMPSMVSITNISVQEVQDYFGRFNGGQGYVQESQSSGTGIIIGKTGNELLIVTNNHVVDGANTLSVCFVDNEVCEATIKGTDEDNDIAVISVKLSDIKSDTMSQIKVAPIGDSDDLVVGEQVVAIGNALGYGQSVTTGIVSALDRTVSGSDACMIQTDAAINPGNSGGALLNMKGEVIGINSVKYSSTEVEGMGYAISMKTAGPIIEELMNRETREKVASDKTGRLGITVEDISEDISNAYGIPQGIYIVDVEKDGAADEAGIEEKSIITKLDGVRVKTSSSLIDLLQYYEAGETIEVTIQVLENGEYVEKEVDVTLGASASSSNDSDNSKNIIQEIFG